MDHIVKQYQKAYHEHGDSPSSVLWPKGRQDIRFFALIKHIPLNSSFSILDFGCGLAHLSEYLTSTGRSFDYTGADIVPEFILSNKERYPKGVFINIKDVEDIQQQYDYIVASGTFNILYVNNKQEHTQIVFNYLTHLFNKANVYLSVNFMTDKVDFMQKEAYHQDLNSLIEFVQSKLSKRIIIDHSYMPYEYTITVFKNQEIIRPENTYVL